MYKKLKKNVIAIPFMYNEYKLELQAQAHCIGLYEGIHATRQLELLWDPVWMYSNRLFVWM